MAEIINLRLARKARIRSEAERRAEIQRAAHGRSKAEKQAAKAEAERLRRTTDGAKLDKPEIERGT